ncbi:MAG TPA: hypothetical protein VH062_10500 [Polyangiaceae bacterium]|jgi:hypothetical protein|nr:hypothetical protein [Polyangiaceae bacterium]
MNRGALAWVVLLFISSGGVLLVAGSAAGAPTTSKASKATKATKKATKKPAHHHHQRGRAPSFPGDATADASPASRAARLTESECYAELERDHVRFEKAGPSPGILIPVRLTGPVRGVAYRTDFPDKQRSKVPWEVFDCRLVVALAAWSPTLAAHGIDEVRMFSAWRPPSPHFPAGKVATAHPGGLAADLRLFKRGSEPPLDVLADFNGRIGTVPCGKGAAPPIPDTPAARTLHEIYCAAADAHLFHVQLCPDHDGPHRNHFHVEVRPAVRWFIVE